MSFGSLSLLVLISSTASVSAVISVRAVANSSSLASRVKARNTVAGGGFTARNATAFTKSEMGYGVLGHSGMREYRVLAQVCPDGLLIQRLSQCLAHRRRCALSFVFPAFSSIFGFQIETTKEHPPLNLGHLRSPLRRRLSRAYGCICTYSPLITYSS